MDELEKMRTDLLSAMFGKKKQSMTCLRVSSRMSALCSAAFPGARAAKARSPHESGNRSAARYCPWIPICGSNCTWPSRGPGWWHWSRRGPIPKRPTAAWPHTIGLQDFLDVYDELNDNIDTYVDRKSDLRKVLKTVIDGDTEFQAKLRALRDDATAKKAETEQYEFLLTNALDTLDSSVQDHRQLLSEQEEAFKQKKKPAETLSQDVYGMLRLFAMPEVLPC